MRLSTKITALAVSAAFMIGAPTALAQSSAEDGYSIRGGVVQTQLDSDNPASEQSGAPAASVQSNDSKLPFTGLDIALIVGAGGMLMLLGFGIRRLSRPAPLA